MVRTNAYFYQPEDLKAWYKAIERLGITMACLYLGPNALDSDTRQWLITLRRPGKLWTVRFYGFDEHAEEALKFTAGETEWMAPPPEILCELQEETGFATTYDKFLDDLEIVWRDWGMSYTPWDERTHRHFCLLAEGFRDFFGGVEIPVSPTDQTKSGHDHIHQDPTENSPHTAEVETPRNI
jgi:hypothetical protein